MSSSQHIKDRNIFKTMEQSHEEEFVSFVERLQRQSNKCHFVDPEDQLRDQIIAGCSSNKLSREAIEGNMTLQQVVARGKTIEEAEINSFITLSNDILKENKRKCTLCGYYGGYKSHICKGEPCEAIEAACLFCKGFGHFALVCPQRKRKNNDLDRDQLKTHQGYKRQRETFSSESTRHKNNDQPSTSYHQHSEKRGKVTENILKPNNIQFSPENRPKTQTNKFYAAPNP